MKGWRIGAGIGGFGGLLAGYALANIRRSSGQSGALPFISIVPTPDECSREDAPFLCGMNQAVFNIWLTWMVMPAVAGGIIGYALTDRKGRRR